MMSANHETSLPKPRRKREEYLQQQISSLILQQEGPPVSTTFMDGEQPMSRSCVGSGVGARAYIAQHTQQQTRQSFTVSTIAKGSSSASISQISSPNLVGSQHKHVKFIHAHLTEERCSQGWLTASSTSKGHSWHLSRLLRYSRNGLCGNSYDDEGAWKS